MTRITWQRFQWQCGEETFTFETSDGGLFATLTHMGGRTVTLPLAAWEGMLSCLETERRARTTRVSDLPARSGARWSQTEVTRLVDGFRAGESPAALAARHNRTEGSIETQLERLGLWNRLEHRPLLTDAVAAEPPSPGIVPTAAVAGPARHVATRPDDGSPLDGDAAATAWQRWPNEIEPSPFTPAQR